MSDMTAWILGTGVVAGALIDIRTRRVPNVLTLSMASCGVALAVFHLSGVNLTTALAGCAVGLALMLPGHVIGATGAGDVKLFAAAGTFLGPAGVLTAFVYTLVAGGVLAAAAAAHKGVLGITLHRAAVLVQTRGANAAAIEDGSVDNCFPYAPAIAIGTLAVALGF
jgi:prepilin peptidase CpaA